MSRYKGFTLSTRDATLAELKRYYSNTARNISEGVVVFSEHTDYVARRAAGHLGDCRKREYFKAIKGVFKEPTGKQPKNKQEAKRAALEEVKRVIDFHLRHYHNK